MRLIKLSSIFVVLGFIFLGLSYVTAKGLEESKNYRFPESVARHYAKVSGNVFEGQIGGDAIVFKKSIPVDPNNAFDTVEIETTGINVELTPNSDNGQIEIELMSNKAEPNEPILVDSSRGKTLRIMTQEEKSSGKIGKRGWMVFHFDDDVKPIKNNYLLVRVPKDILNAKIETVSGNTNLATVLKHLTIQSKSGDFSVATTDNPLARVDYLTFQSVSGDLKGPARFDHLKFNSVSGDIKLSNLDRLLELNAETVSGDLNLFATEPLDLAVDFRTTSGDLRIANSLLPKNANGKREKKYKAGIPFTFGKGTVQIKFQSVSGDLRIHKAKSESDAEDESNDETESDPENESGDEANLVEPGSPSKVGNEMYAEQFLSCAAKIAAREQTRIGASAARRCFRIIV